MKMITERLKFADVFPDKAIAVAQRLHIKKDEIPFVRKYYTAEKNKTEIKKKERAVISYISTGIKDRDGEMLMPEGVLLENYQKNPVVPFGHDYRSIPPAKNMWIKKDEKGLVAKTVFAKNQRADEYYQAYTEDVGGTGPLLNAFSVGFIPLEWEDTDKKALEKDPSLPKRTYNKWELLEYSLVPIPSCAEALTIAIEKGLISKKLQKDLEIEVVKDRKEKTIEIIREKAIDGIKDANEKVEKVVEIMVEKDEEKGKQLEDYEYLLHHIEANDEGEEEVHHCYVYDHIANLFEQEHLVVADGKVHLGEKEIKDGIFHVINGLEPTQEVAWGNAEAKKAKIKLKGLKSGMTLKQKAKVW